MVNKRGVFSRSNNNRYIYCIYNIDMDESRILEAIASLRRDMNIRFDKVEKRLSALEKDVAKVKQRQ